MSEYRAERGDTEKLEATKVREHEGDKCGIRMKNNDPRDVPAVLASVSDLNDDTIGAASDEGFVMDMAHVIEEDAIVMNVAQESVESDVRIDSDRHHEVNANAGEPNVEWRQLLPRRAVTVPSDQESSATSASTMYEDDGWEWQQVTFTRVRSAGADRRRRVIPAGWRGDRRTQRSQDFRFNQLQ